MTTAFGAFEFANALALQPDGKLVAAGVALGNPSGSDFGLARYNSDGSLDGTFGASGKVVTSFGPFDAAFALALQPDGKLVAAGSVNGGLGDLDAPLALGPALADALSRCLHLAVSFPASAVDYRI